MKKPKNYNQTFLWRKANYEPKLIEFLMQSEEIRKDDPSFDDIRYQVKKRQVSNSLVKVLDSNNVKLLIGNPPLPKAFKSLAAIDIKGDNKLKIFIDCDVITKTEGVYKCANIDILIAYLVSSMTNLVYYVEPERFIMKNEISKYGSHAFASMFTYVIDYLYKISTVSGLRDKCSYLASIYYQVNLLEKGIDESSVKANARSVSGLSEREEEMLFIQLTAESDFIDINSFTSTIGRVLRLPDLTIDLLLEKWLYLFGSGTQFALELFPAFATMMTNVYVGCYLNNQKTIEKITGSSMVNFVDAVLRVGADAV